MVKNPQFSKIYISISIQVSAKDTYQPKDGLIQNSATQLE
jgi:hypothetical protein